MEKLDVHPLYCHIPLKLGQARIQDFAQGVATAKRGPEIRGPRGQGPKGIPINNQKLCRFGPLFFRWGRFTFLFAYVYYLSLSYFTAQGALAPVPSPPLDTSLSWIDPNLTNGLSVVSALLWPCPRKARSWACFKAVQLGSWFCAHALAQHPTLICSASLTLNLPCPSMILTRAGRVRELN